MRLQQGAQMLSLRIFGERYQDMSPNELLVRAAFCRKDAATIHCCVLVIDAGRDGKC